jgi:hypothetical protein
MILALLIFNIVSIFLAIYIASERKAESLLIEKPGYLHFGYLLPNLGSRVGGLVEVGP